MILSRYRFRTFFIAALAWVEISHAQLEEEIVVYGRAEQQIGDASSATEGMTGYDDIRLPPLLRVGELVESVPGMIATQHSGTGKANQYFLRGFNLDHGTDFSVRVDGVPVNLRSHGHGQGYLDLNFIIPELIAQTRFRKGPYHPESGDFSSAGAVDFRTHKVLPETQLKVTAGEDDFTRVLAAGSTQFDQGSMTAAIDSTTYDGPWELPESLRQHKAHVAYSSELAGNPFTVAFNAYENSWDATDQIPDRAVANGTIDRLGFIDPDLGGETTRYALNADITIDEWQIGGYLVDYDFTLYSNFTYLLEDPNNSDQFEQRDRRVLSGLWLTKTGSTTLGDLPLSYQWGADYQRDDIREIGLYNTTARVRTNTIRDDEVTEQSLAFWGEAEIELNPDLRISTSLRADHFDWDVTASRPANSGDGNDELISPAMSIAYRLNEGLETYLNWGRGYHSNDVRGATINIDPQSGQPAEQVPALVASEGAEIGLRLEHGRSFNASVAAFWLELDSELVYVGDAGTTEANNASERVGLEVSTFWQATDELAIYGDYTWTDASFQRDTGDGKEIPGAVEQTLVLGANWVFSDRFSTSLRARYLGEAPLTESGAITSDPSWLLNLAAQYRIGAVELALELFNATDSDDNDITYFYASRLPGEPADGVEDFHYHPLEPRTVRVSLSYHW